MLCKQIVTVWDKVSSDSTRLELAGWLELKELRQNWKLYNVPQKTMSSKVTRKLHDKQAGNEFEWNTSLNRSLENQHYAHLKLIYIIPDILYKEISKFFISEKDLTI